MARALEEIAAIFEGLSLTFRYLFKEPITVSYPEIKRQPSQRFRGRHWLRLWPDGQERCVGCQLCQIVCPVHAILVIPADNPPDKPLSKAKRYAKEFQINMLRCIFCGSCEEACPVDAIILSNDYELAGYRREEMIFTKEKLMEKQPGDCGRDPTWGPKTAPRLQEKTKAATSG